MIRAAVYIPNGFTSQGPDLALFSRGPCRPACSKAQSTRRAPGCRVSTSPWASPSRWPSGSPGRCSRIWATRTPRSRPSPTGSIGIAWSLKPIWASFLDMYRTKRFFVLSMEVLLSVMLAGIALALQMPNYFQIIVAVLWVMAFSSATQDICVDGVYITSLDKKGQAAWIGLQGVFWTLGRPSRTGQSSRLAGTPGRRGAVLKPPGRTRSSSWRSSWSRSPLTTRSCCPRAPSRAPPRETSKRSRPPRRSAAASAWVPACCSGQRSPTPRVG